MILVSNKTDFYSLFCLVHVPERLTQHFNLRKKWDFFLIPKHRFPHLIER